jgi:hypothetical protein
VFKGTRQELAIFWMRGARATTRLRRDRRRAIPKPKFALLIQDSKLRREEGSRRKAISSSLYIYIGLPKPGLGGAGYRL